MHILHVDSSILGDHSVSRALSAAAVARLRNEAPDARVTYRDLAAHPLTHLSGAYLAGQREDVQHDQALQEDLALGGAALAEFLEADAVVVGAPLYNFGISSQLKAWIDRVVVAGKTFRYNSEGKPEGLAGGKRLILTIARGGFYGVDSPIRAYEHAETYLRTVFGFIGLPNPEVFTADGIATGPEQREKAVQGALAEIGRLAA